MNVIVGRHLVVVIALQDAVCRAEADLTESWSIGGVQHVDCYNCCHFVCDTSNCNVWLPPRRTS